MTKIIIINHSQVLSNESKLKTNEGKDKHGKLIQ